MQKQIFLTTVKTFGIFIDLFNWGCTPANGSCEFTSISSVSGQVAQLYLCDVLARGYEQKTDIDTDKLKERALQAVIKKSI